MLNEDEVRITNLTRAMLNNFEELADLTGRFRGDLGLLITFHLSFSPPIDHPEYEEHVKSIIETLLRSREQPLHEHPRRRKHDIRVVH
jgi:hypothetical protein